MSEQDEREYVAYKRGVQKGRQDFRRRVEVYRGRLDRANQEIATLQLPPDTRLQVLGGDPDRTNEPPSPSRRAPKLFDGPRGKLLAYHLWKFQPRRRK